MRIVHRLTRRFIMAFVTMHGRDVFLILLTYFFISYIGLILTQEQELVQLDVFFYFMITVGSTVGFGDFSPSTFYGRLFTSIWIIPLGLSLFALSLTKLGLLLSESVSRKMKGFGMTNHQNHTAIIGWNGSRTERLIQLLRDQDDSGRTVLELYVSSHVEIAGLKKVDLIRVECFTDEHSMFRGSLKQARRIIIDTDSDDVTVTTALFCAKHAPNAHITAHTHDEKVGGLLLNHCENLEIIPDVSVELMAKAALDKGSSHLHKQLLDASFGETQYSYEVSFEQANLQYLELFIELKKKHSATLIAILKAGQSNIHVNADADLVVENGDTLFYVADTRLESTAFESTLK